MLSTKSNENILLVLFCYQHKILLFKRYVRYLLLCVLHSALRVPYAAQRLSCITTSTTLTKHCVIGRYPTLEKIYLTGSVGMHNISKVVTRLLCKLSGIACSDVTCNRPLVRQQLIALAFNFVSI